MAVLVLILLGLMLGSFVNAFTWRLHEHKDWINGRSECPKCHHQLAAKDLVPVFSWLALKGKCRYCHKKIEDNSLPELLTPGAFVFSYCFWPKQLHGAEVAVFGLWLVILVLFMSLVIYDLRWRLLPNKLVYPLIILAVISLLITSVEKGETWRLFTGALWGVMLLGGLFYVLFQVSAGRWIGGGDVKLGAALGILVGGPLNSVMLLLLASSLGTLYALPSVATGQAKRNSQIPFGPFLIIAAFVVRLFGASVIAWYKSGIGR